MFKNYALTLQNAYIFTFFLTIITIFSSFAQTGSIAGTIQTTDGKPAEFVNISIKGTTRGTAANASGSYEINNIKVGTYTIIASFIGLETKTQTVSVKANDVLTLNFTLRETAEELSEIVVKGYQNANDKTVNVGKLPIKSMDLPQSIAVIDRQILDNQLAMKMSDVLMNTNGVYISGTTGGYQEEISGRGFAFNSSNTLKNGVRYFNGMLTELSSVERVEVLKGSSAILFGNVAAGGVINLVTKKPKFGFGGEIDFKTGSFGLLKPTFDVYGGIGKGEVAAFRLNGSYEKANSFREGVRSERYYVNPSVLVNLGRKTNVLLEMDYLKDKRTPDFGAGIVNYELVNLPRERFLGVAWSYFKSEQTAAKATVTHHFSDKWQLTGTAAYRQYATDLFANARPNSGTLINKEGTWIRNIQRSEVSEDYFLGQLDLTGSFKTGKIAHNLLFGGDVDQFKTLTTAYTALNRYDTINIYGTKTYNTRTDMPALAKSTLTTSPVSRFGVYIQDLVTLTKQLKALVGVRYSYQQTGSDVLTYSTNKTTSIVSFDGAFTPRFGLVYQPTEKHSVFASYANSFTLNTGVDITGNALPPSFINQYEVGVKNNLLRGNLSVNATAYRILNSNLAQISLANGNTNTNIKELTGSVESRGVELDIEARPSSAVSVRAGYSYNETKYVKSNTFVEGSFLKYNPNNTANVSVFYTFEQPQLKGLRVGVSSLYFGKRYAGRSTRVQVANDTYKLTPLSDYTQVDATAAYSFKKITLRAKMGNIFNVLNYNVHDDNSVNPIAPRNYQLNFCYKF